MSYQRITIPVTIEITIDDFYGPLRYEDYGQVATQVADALRDKWNTDSLGPFRTGLTDKVVITTEKHQVILDKHTRTDRPL